jgi:hypothetical protein
VERAEQEASVLLASRERRVRVGGQEVLVEQEQRAERGERERQGHQDQQERQAGLVVRDRLEGSDRLA